MERSGEDISVVHRFCHEEGVAEDLEDPQPVAAVIAVQQCFAAIGVRTEEIQKLGGKK